jgi:hypothetical protein
MKKFTFILLALFLWCGQIFAQNAIQVSGSNLADGQYLNLKGAFAAINGNDQTGMNILVSVIDDSNEGITTTELNEGGWVSLTIVPSGAPRLIFGNVAGAPLLNLNGADRVLIDGNLGNNVKGLTIRNSSTSNLSTTSTIRFINDAQHNTVTWCNIEGSATVPLATNGGTIFFHTGLSGGTGNDNNTISNNAIRPSPEGLPSKGIFGNGSQTNYDIANSQILIEQNEIFDWYLAGGCAGIYVGLGNTAWTINNLNLLYQTAPRNITGQSYGIYFVNTTHGDDLQVSHNIIGYQNNMQTGNMTWTGYRGFRCNSFLFKNGSYSCIYCK